MKNLITQPTYINEFSCISSECKESCCKEWTISVDKKTFKKYKNIKNKDTRTKILDNISKANNPSNLYATMNLTGENKECSLLEEGLCYIHKELGSGYLSKICSQFPRLVNRIDNEMEFSLSAGCEEAARLIMDNENGIEFELKEINDTSDYSAMPIYTKQDKSLLYRLKLHNLRPFIIEILQFRDFSIHHRLMLVGLFLRNIEKANSTSEIDTIVESYKTHICSGVYDNLIIDISAEKDRFLAQQFQIGFNFIDVYLKKHTASALLRNLCTNLESNFIDKTKGLDIETLLKNHKSVESFIERNEYLIENYLVNYVFSKTVPCSDKYTPTQSYALMSLRIYLLKLFLASEFNEKDDITKDKAIRLMSTISKSIDHNTTLNDNFIKMLKEEELELCIVMASV